MEVMLAALALAALAGATQSASDRAALAMRSPTVRADIGPIDTPLAADLAQFLLDHPDLSSDLVRAHKIAPYRISMIGPARSTADDGNGIRGTIDLLERTPARRVYFADGVFDRPALPTIKATAVIVLRVTPLPDEACPPKVRSEFEVYVRLRNPVLATLVKTLRPFISRTAISRFSRAFVAAQKLGELIAREPDAVFGEILAHPGLSDPERSAARSLGVRARETSARCPAAPR
jgi:hypothetical protein